jgi:hypothetical protein
MTSNSFSAGDFARSIDPWAYIVDSGILQAPTTDVRAEVQELHTKMDKLDEVHLAFALAIGEVHTPEEFGLTAARLLAHPSQSVRIKAYRVLNAIPSEHITGTLKSAVERELQECPERREFADVLTRI